MALHTPPCCYSSKIVIGLCFLWHMPILLLYFFHMNFFHMKINMIQLTPVDKVAEVEGVSAIYRKATLTVARANNTKFKRIFKQLLKPYKRQIEKGNLDDETSEELMVTAYSEAILVGWKDLKDINGKIWPYSKVTVPNRVIFKFKVSTIIQKYSAPHYITMGFVYSVIGCKCAFFD